MGRQEDYFAASGPQGGRMAKVLGPKLRAALAAAGVAAGSKYKGKDNEHAVYAVGSLEGLMVELLGEGEPGPEVLWWSGGLPIPKIGDAVTVTTNQIGPGYVVGYFTEYNWLGVEVAVTKPAAWFRKQNGPGAHALVYGVEFKLGGNP